jgi:hypothetical protein
MGPGVDMSPSHGSQSPALPVPGLRGERRHPRVAPLRLLPVVPPRGDSALLRASPCRTNERLALVPLSARCLWRRRAAAHRPARLWRVPSHKTLVLSLELAIPLSRGCDLHTVRSTAPACEPAECARWLNRSEARQATLALAVGERHEGSSSRSDRSRRQALRLAQGVHAPRARLVLHPLYPRHVARPRHKRARRRAHGRRGGRWHENGGHHLVATIAAQASADVGGHRQRRHALTIQWSAVSGPNSATMAIPMGRYGEPALTSVGAADECAHQSRAELDRRVGNVSSRSPTVSSKSPAAKAEGQGATLKAQREVAWAREPRRRQKTPAKTRVANAVSGVEVRSRARKVGGAG